MRRIPCFALSLFLFVFVSCKNGNNSTTANTDTAKTDGHPSWIMQGNIYEVNVRQYTPEGTFQAFAKHLDRLKEMGVQTLWFMPINPISKVDRKGSLGSYYAVSDYTAINPEYGTMDDWKALVKQAHEKGFKVLIDWVPNHTGADHYWLRKHPDFYVKDSTGKPVSQFDWTDTRKLNFNNAELRDTMIKQMKYWITETGIDGLRCDYAVGPSRAFWKDCIKELKATKNVFMLAEADSAWLHEVGFDATYAWPEFNMQKLIAAGKRNAAAMDSVLAFTDSTLPKNGLRLFFTSNHDENSWNKADYATMPGASHAPFAVLTQTMKRSIPLIYSSQEEPLLRSIKFFDKDTIGFSKFERAGFYQKLLTLHSSNEALSANASFTRIATKADDKIYAYAREKNGKKVVVILNLSNTPQSFTTDNSLVIGVPTEIFSNRKDPIQSGKKIELPAWGYLVYSY
jgi:alpha-amylase